MLADDGYIARTVGGGQAALDYLHTHPAPCCIIVDLVMPILDGWQFHRAHLRSPQLASIPVVVMSAVAHALQPFAWFQAKGYVQKPFAVDDVLALIAPLCALPDPRP